jgi:alpha-tubulin suppressor-like RCC1 family protein
LGGSCKCPDGQAACGHKCIDLDTDKDNCGACGVRCGVRCDAGACLGVESVAAGFVNTCALLTDGSAWCWGDNGYGQLGLGTMTGPLSCASPDIFSDAQFACATTPVRIPDLTGVRRLVSGWSDVCGLMTNGDVKCWGDNEHGQLGDGTTTTRPLPAPVPGLHDVVMLSAGMATNCALAHGIIACWGSNSYGQLGDGTTTDRWLPTPVAGLAGVVSVSAGGTHTCALLGDGTVQCWGNNWYGQLGDGTTLDHALPAPVAGLSEVIAISAGDRQTCALEQTGSVLCWGQGYTLGAGKTAEGAPLPQPVPGLANVLALGAGYSSTCALRKDGSVACWGNGSSGEIGNGTGEPAYSPVDIDGLDSVVAISAGVATHSCAVLATGALVCWGDNGSGELGIGTNQGPERCGYPMDSGGTPCAPTPSPVAWP